MVEKHETDVTYGGEIVGRTLKEGGVQAMFGIYGSINLAIEKGCQLGIDMFHFRHEQSAGFAADAYARAARKPGICFTSSAPGFTNIVSPIAQAKSALSPVVLLNGQHGITGDGVDTIQEGYATEVMRPFSKWTHRCIDWHMHAYWTKKALTEAVQYPPGPIVLEFPRNALNERGPGRQLKHVAATHTPVPSPPHGDPREIERALQMLRAASRPLLIAGDGIYWSDGAGALRELAERLNIPVHTRRTARGAVPENHPLAFTGGYRGALFREADVVCIIGLRATYLEEWFEPPEWRRDVRYIQIQEATDEVWPGLPTEVAIVGASGAVLGQMLQAHRQAGRPTPERRDWLATLNDARERFKARQQSQIDQWRKAQDGLIHPHALGASITDVLDDHATVIYDSFTATSFLTDKLEAKYAGQILDAGLHQPVGHGIGMAIGAQVARPGRQVLALMGDGGFGISAMDMETLVRYKLPAVIVVMNNDGWSGVAAGHDAFYPDMGSWDNSHGIRYDRMFKEVGCHTEHCVAAEEITPALERAFASGKPSLVHVVGDTREIHPLRLRICWGDAWTRGNLENLPASAKALVKRNASVKNIKRVHKFWIDNGVDIPMKELAAMADISEQAWQKLLDDDG